MKRVLQVNKLSRDAFEPYGQIIDHHGLEPVMGEEQFTFWNNLAQTSIEGKADFGMLEVVKRERTFSKIERHILTAEVFFALDNDCLMLAGQPTPGERYANPETVKVFHLSKG
jgi:ureidoglycolate hydrolase